MGTNLEVPNIGSQAASATISLKKSVVRGTTRGCLSGSLASSSRIADAGALRKRLLLPPAGVPLATARRWCQLRSMLVYTSGITPQPGQCTSASYSPVWKAELKGALSSCLTVTSMPNFFQESATAKASRMDCTSKLLGSLIVMVQGLPSGSCH